MGLGLTGRVASVTDGSYGIGQAVADPKRLRVLSPFLPRNGQVLLPALPTTSTVGW